MLNLEQKKYLIFVYYKQENKQTAGEDIPHGTANFSLEIKRKEARPNQTTEQ